MPKIVHVINTYFAATYFVGEQFRYFGSRGYEMHLICPASPYIDEYRSKMGFSFFPVTITRRYSPLCDLVALMKICNYLRKTGPDVIVGHTPKGGMLAMLAGRITGVKTRIYFRHGLPFETAKGLSRRILIATERINAGLSTKVVIVSRSVYRESMRYRLNPENRQIVLGMGTCGGIDASGRYNPDLVDKPGVRALKASLGISETDYVVGFTGRLVRDKGIADLIAAFDLLTVALPNRTIKLLLVGMFEERDSLPAEIRSRILSDNSIIYTGFVNEGIEKYYAMMNQLVLPTYREGLPISVIEASSMRIPVITTRVTGSVDSIVENHTGIFVDNNPVSIAEGIKHYIENPDISKRHGENGRAHVLSNFDHPIIWKEIEKLYAVPSFIKTTQKPD